LGEIIDFMNECAGVLELEGDEKSAFYFEQIAEFLTENPYKGLKEHAGRVLGL